MVFRAPFCSGSFLLQVHQYQLPQPQIMSSHIRGLYGSGGEVDVDPAHTLSSSELNHMILCSSESGKYGLCP